ncbi:MAG: gamma-glutamylcyclotransferase, partial [Phycisphaerae bacterium]|nr:gamma-glutamylcyclotransferase [Phycisphaerae bacterium]
MPVEKKKTYNLFIYGTLTDAAVFRAVMGKRLVSIADRADGVESFWARRAVLDGYKKISPDNTYVYAVPDKGHRIRGYLVHTLPIETLAALKEYEGQNYSRRTIKVHFSEGQAKAMVFVGNLKHLEHAFGHSFRDPLKQEIILTKKIDNAIRETEEQQLHTDDEFTRRAVTELSGVAIRDIQRRHFEVGGISDFAIRHALKDRPIRDYDRIRRDQAAVPVAKNYLRMVIRQVVFNQFEERIRREFRFELDHLPHPNIYYDRVISSLIALRILNQSQAVLDAIVSDCLDELEFPTNHLIDFVRRAIIGAEALYDPKHVKTHLNFVRRHLGFGFVPLGAELEFSNIGHSVIASAAGPAMQDAAYDGFMYFYDFGLDVLTWKLGGHIDDHREKSHGKPRRGFFEVALGNLSIEANISKPITPDPWVLNQLIHHTMQFYDITPHSIHISMQPRSQHRPDRDRLLPLGILQCFFAIAGDPVRHDNGSFRIQRLSTDEIVRQSPRPNFLFSEISKRYSQLGDEYLPSRGKEGTYVQQFRFLRLSPHLNYEPIAMGLKGIQLSLRPGTFLSPGQWERSRRHRATFEALLDWGRSPEPLSRQEIDKFLSCVQEGLMTERRGKPAHSRAYIAWSLSQLAAMLQRFNDLIT